VQKLNALMPDHPRFLSILALIQAIREDLKAANETLKRAEKLARQQKDTEGLEIIHRLREELNSPFGSLIGPMLKMRSLLGDVDDIDELGGMLEDFMVFDDDDDEEEDLFS
jgi:hypothetical protein